MKSLGLVTCACVMVAGMGMVMTQTPEELCTLASHNISMMSKDRIPYFMKPNVDTRLYVSLCHPLGDLSSSGVSDLCDKTAFACITKMRDGKEVEFVRNAGSVSKGLSIEESHSAIRLNYTGGNTCVNMSKRNSTYRTNIDFLCNQGEDQPFYAGLIDNCLAQVYWQTELACLPGQLEDRETGSCLLEIPGYDVRLDLTSWAHERYHSARSGPGNRTFQLNLCSDVKEGLCTDNSLVCEVDSDHEKLVQNIIEEKPKRTVTYNPLTEVITLKYEDRDKDTVYIDIECDHNSSEPELVLTSNKGREFHFSMKTDKACFLPAVQCSAENQMNEIFNFENLMKNEWDFTLHDSKTIYQIKVCGSLPILAQQQYKTYPCQKQTGICTFDNSEDNEASARSLGVMKKRPVVNEDGSISMMYEGGDNVTMKNENQTCSLGAEIIFRCHPDVDKGPMLLTAEECRHTLEWLTPEACPVKVPTSHSCAVRESTYSHMFNLTELHNEREDNVIKADNRTFYFNLCGDLNQPCPEDSLCLSSAVNLTYNTDLRMELTSDKKCDVNRNFTVDIVFLCHHDIPIGHPEVLQSSGDLCHYSWQWRTQLACPPHEVIPCSLQTPEGEVDLSVLSLPDDNYMKQVSGTGGVVVLNVCRSVVHSKSTSCPYHSAACFIKTAKGQVTHESLGEVQSGGLKFDSEDNQVFLEYKLGSICPDHPDRSHIETVIYFKCDENVTDSEPELVDSSNCLWKFDWRHAAACPVRRTVHTGCRVTNPNTGFTYDLSSLKKTGSNYQWAGMYRHLKGSFQFNICGGLVNSQCRPEAGVCSKNETNFGRANSDLVIEDGQLYLNYTGGDICEDGQQSQTRISFFCPYIRNFTSSGNYEPRNKKYKVEQQTRCYTEVIFPTELACEHQVLCEASRGDKVFSLTQLRRHQDNYHVSNIDPSKPEFMLNICGPLVAADITSTACSPHSACTLDGDSYKGLGTAETAPRLDESGDVVIEYTGGGTCNTRGDHGEEWSTRVVFRCDMTTATSDHPFGYPRHVSTNIHDCVHTFDFPTVLVCKDVFETEPVSEPDSCIIYHSGIQDYINITDLMQDTPYIVKNPTRLGGIDQFEIQPCGRTVPSCRGAICYVSDSLEKPESLGHMTDFIYDHTMDRIKVDFKEGSICNIRTKKRWTSRIYYSCDPEAGRGHPERDETFQCVQWFMWRTSYVCTSHHHKGRPDILPAFTTSVRPEQTTPEIQPINVVTESHHAKEPLPVSGGTSASSWFVLLLAIAVIVTGLVLYLKPEARERVFRVVQGARARLPVFLGGRSREDTSLLVSDGRMTSSGFGAMSEEFS